MNTAPAGHWTETTEGRIAHYATNPYVAECIVYTTHHDRLGDMPGDVLHFAHAGAHDNAGAAWAARINARHAKGKLPFRVTIQSTVDMAAFRAQR